MLKSQYKSFDELPLSLNMTEVAGVLGISVSSAYELARMDSFPSFRLRMQPSPFARLLIMLRHIFDLQVRLTSYSGYPTTL